MKSVKVHKLNTLINFRSNQFKIVYFIKMFLFEACFYMNVIYVMLNQSYQFFLCYLLMSSSHQVSTPLIRRLTVFGVKICTSHIL